MIAESGSSLEYWAIDADPIYSASMYGDICECNGQDLYKCLNGKEAVELAVCTHDMVVGGYL